MTGFSIRTTIGRPCGQRAGWGVFLGNIMGVVLKLVYTGVVLFVYIREMWR